MPDATTHAHSHEDGLAHDHDSTPSSAPARLVPAGFSLIGASAWGRLLPALTAVAALWAGVYWALH